LAHRLAVESERRAPPNLGHDLLGPFVPRGFVTEANALPARSFVYAASVATRKALASASAVAQPVEIEFGDDEPPTLQECAREFVPTMICLRRPANVESLSFKEDLDHGRFPRFLSAVYVVERDTPRGSGRVIVQSARAYLAPPAIATEVDERARLVSESGKGVPLPFNQEDGGSFGLLTRLLTEPERNDVRALPVDEQLAVVTVLAAREGMAAVASYDGECPSTPLVSSIAERLGCRLVRCSIRNVSLDVLTRIQQVRYVRR